jgi:hypothetical protein
LSAGAVSLGCPSFHGRSHRRVECRLYLLFAALRAVGPD